MLTRNRPTPRRESDGHRGRWVEAHETAELLAPYGEWAGLAGLYLGTAFTHGLIPLPTERPVRFPRPAYA
jgi:hypothetical protein